LILINNIKFIFRGHQDKFVNTRLFNYDTLIQIKYNKNTPGSTEFDGNIIKSINNNVYLNMLEQYNNKCFDDNIFKPTKDQLCANTPIITDFPNIAGMNWDELDKYSGQLSDKRNRISRYFIKNEEVKQDSNVATFIIPTFYEIPDMYDLFAPLLTLSTAESKTITNDSFVILNIPKVGADIRTNMHKNMYGGNNNQNYKNKYLKYKQKYLSLKNSQI
jgi:hypothetical protein